MRSGRRNGRKGRSGVEMNFLGDVSLFFLVQFPILPHRNSSSSETAQQSGALYDLEWFCLKKGKGCSFLLEEQSMPMGTWL